MPVGTKGTVKGLTPGDLRSVGAGVVLGNTYHLYLRPGSDLVKEAGGLHRFMGWDGPILTDSGGYQVFSLAETRSISEKGVEFASVYDGSRHEFTPELTTRVQEDLGSDVAMVLEYDVPLHSELLVAVATDTEATQSYVSVMRKRRRGSEGTVADYRRGLAEQAVYQMLNERFDELSRKKDAQLPRRRRLRAGAEPVGRRLCAGRPVSGRARLPKAWRHSRSKPIAFSSSGSDRGAGSGEEVVARIVRARLQRAREEASEFVRRRSTCNHFLQGEPAAGIEYQYRLAQTLISSHHGRRSRRVWRGSCLPTRRAW